MLQAEFIKKSSDKLAKVVTTRNGVSLKTALIYRNARLYELAMLTLYGRHYTTRYEVLADLIQGQSTILDLGCGPGILYQRYLRPKKVDYTGLDINEGFVKRVNAIGARGFVWDLRSDRELPAADYVVMEACLYHFLPDPVPVVDRMLHAARKEVIVAEPIRNWSSDNRTILSKLGKVMTDPGTGRQSLRFNEQSLDDFFSCYRAQVEKAFVIPGGREKVYLLNANTSRAN